MKPDGTTLGEHTHLATYNSVTQLGLTAPASLSDVWDALPQWSVLIAPSTDFVAADRPSASAPGTIELVKGNPGSIHAYVPGLDYRMGLFSSNPGTTPYFPTMVWKKLIDAEYALTSLIKVYTVTIPSISVAAGGDASGSTSAKKVGYTPIGIVGYRLPGTGSSNAAVYRLYLDSNGMVNAYLRSVNGAITSTVVVYVLYIEGNPEND